MNTMTHVTSPWLVIQAYDPVEVAEDAEDIRDAWEAERMHSEGLCPCSACDERRVATLPTMSYEDMNR